MKCPKCGSDHCQFYSTTKGGGCSAEKSCCGYILLGPLGLLCGALDSKPTTEEFWVCQFCGNRFTTYDSQRKEREIQKQKQEAAKYKQYAKDIAETNLTQEDLTKIIEEISSQISIATDERKVYLKQLCSSEDEQIRKLAQKLSSEFFTNLLIILLAVGLISIFVVLPFGLLLSIATFLSFAVLSNYEDMLSEQLCQLDCLFKDLHENMKRLEKEKEKYKELRSKINFVNNYHA